MGVRKAGGGGGEAMGKRETGGGGGGGEAVGVVGVVALGGDNINECCET